VREWLAHHKTNKIRQEFGAERHRSKPNVPLVSIQDRHGRLACRGRSRRLTFGRSDLRLHGPFLPRPQTIGRKLTVRSQISSGVYAELAPRHPAKFPCSATNRLDTRQALRIRSGYTLPDRTDIAGVLGSVKHKPLTRRPSGLLDRPCARWLGIAQVGTAGSVAFRSNSQSAHAAICKAGVAACRSG